MIKKHVHARSLALVMFLAAGEATEAQVPRTRPRPERPSTPFADPSRFFDTLFGEESDQERKQANAVKVTPQEEAQLGSAAYNVFRQQLKQRHIKLVERGDDVDYLRSLVDKVRPLMNHAARYRRVQVLLADAEDTDAICFPGGTVIVFRGLLDFCESEAALVGILGHELSHLDHGHQLYHLKRWKLMQQSFRGGFDPRKFVEMSGTMAKMFMRPFRPEEETEADEDGVRWAFELGYEPAAMAGVFHRLAQRDQNKPDFVPSFLRSHPYHEDRYRAILKRGAALKSANANRTLYVGKQNLQSRQTRFRQEFADEFVP